jgi:hypothetical protein
MASEIFISVSEEGKVLVPLKGTIFLYFVFIVRLMK